MMRSSCSRTWLPCLSPMLIARERLSDFYARTTCSTTASESVLQRAEDSATYAYVLDQSPLGSNLRCSRHRARHDVGGDTMGCLEAGISAALGAALVCTDRWATRLLSTSFLLVVTGL